MHNETRGGQHDEVQSEGMEQNERDFEEVVDIDEDAYEVAEDFLNRNLHTDKDELRTIWGEKYQEDPLNFFDTKNKEFLQGMDPVDRLYLLSLTCANLQVTPRHLEQFFVHFPKDRAAITAIFHTQNGRAQGTLEHYIYTLAAPFMQSSDSSVARYSGFRQYEEIAERRALSPQFLLKGHANIKGGQEFHSKFGRAADGILHALSEASDLSINGEYMIDPNQIFTSEYKDLDGKSRAELLRDAVGEIQLSLVFGETFNSAFTRERVEDDRRRSKTKSSYNSARHNVAHSMLFKTYQPNTAFELNDEYFEDEMNSSGDIGGYTEEYPYHRLLLAILDNIKEEKADTEKTVDLLVEFWDKNRNPIFINKVADALSTLDPNRAASELLKLLQQETVDKNALSAMLFRLEFGRINITAEGAQYLEKLYDLGEYNKPDFFVERLTAYGQIGIFDTNGELKKYFNLGDLSDQEKQVKAAVLDFTLDQFFSQPAPADSEERKIQETILEEFKKQYFTFFDQEFFENTGVRFNNLSFREQAWFMRFIVTAPPERQDKALELVKKFGEAGLKIFISLDVDARAPDNMFSIVESLGDEQALYIFEKYSELVSSIEKIEDEIHAFFASAPGEVNLYKNKATHEIIQRASRILASFGEIKENTVTTGDIKKALETIQSEIIIFSSIFKTAYQFKKEFKFEDIQGLDFEAKRESPSEEEARQMEEIVAKNYKKTPLLQGVLKGLHTALSSVHNTFYLLKHNGKVVSFDRFEQKLDKEGNPNGEVEFASFNTDPAYQNSAIGTAMMEQTLELNARENTVVADTDPLSPACTNYVEKQGFDIVGYQPYKDTGITVFQIRREKGSTRLKKVSGETISFGSEKEVVENVKKYLDEGKKIVRYFKKGNEFFGAVK